MPSRKGQQSWIPVIDPVISSSPRLTTENVKPLFSRRKELPIQSWLESTGGRERDSHALRCFQLADRTLLSLIEMSPLFERRRRDFFSLSLSYSQDGKRASAAAAEKWKAVRGNGGTKLFTRRMKCRGMPISVERNGRWLTLKGEWAEIIFSP